MELGEYEAYCQVNGNFMQSSCWADVKSNWEHEYITVRNKSGEIEGSMLVLIKKIPFCRSSFFYAPRGPVCDYHNRRILEKIFSQLSLLAKKYNAFSVKIDPMIDESDTEAIENLKRLGFVHHIEKVGYDNIQCRENYILDISGKTSSEIFNSFKSKYRYNIRLAERKGVKCGFFGEEKLDDFMLLMEATSRRDGFCMRSRDYFAGLLNSFKGKAGLCMCYLEDVPLSGALYIEYAGTMSYVYGCSSDSYRNLMPNYLMHWTMIRFACEKKLHTYDFCGIPYYYDESHRNYGVYKFKQGFGGRVKVYAGEFDYSFKPFLSCCADFAMKLRKHHKKASTVIQKND